LLVVSQAKAHGEARKYQGVQQVVSNDYLKKPGLCSLRDG
jgi:hypothetical protein